MCPSVSFGGPTTTINNLMLLCTSPQPHSHPVQGHPLQVAPVTMCTAFTRRTTAAPFNSQGQRIIAVRHRTRQAAAGCQVYSKSSAFGSQLAVDAQNGSKWSMGRWLENRAAIEVPVPVEVCWALWDDRERIPLWMPWIKSVTVQQDNPALSRWTLATHQFGRDWEFSWLARNLAPVRHQKLHWISEPGSASLGLNVNNRGQIRFIRRAGACNVSLSISYEVPDVLAPFANALTPVVEGIISKDMERFRDYATAYAKAQASSKQQQQQVSGA